MRQTLITGTVGPVSIYTELIYSGPDVVHNQSVPPWSVLTLVLTVTPRRGPHTNQCVGRRERRERRLSLNVLGAGGESLAPADERDDCTHGEWYQGCGDDDMAWGRSEVPLPGQTGTLILLTYLLFVLCASFILPCVDCSVFVHFYAAGPVWARGNPPPLIPSLSHLLLYPLVSFPFFPLLFMLHRSSYVHLALILRCQCPSVCLWRRCIGAL